MKVTPYDTGKIKIGCNYEPPLRGQYNSDQDWVQEWLLNIKPDWTKQLDSWVDVGLLLTCAYCVLALMIRD